MRATKRRSDGATEGRQRRGSFRIHPLSLLRPAFTLNELLVVIAIIVLMLGIGTAAFNVMTGNRSLESAENIASAMLGRARTYAIANKVYAGVAFFVNPTNDRTTMAIVVQRPPGAQVEEDPYLQYKGFNATADITNTPPNSRYLKGQEAIGAMVDTDEQRVIVSRFYSISNDHNNPTPSSGPPASNADWGEAQNAGFVDFVIGDEVQLLPPGVGYQLVNDPKTLSPVPVERYLRTGVIMFDSEGKLASIPMTISRLGELGEMIGLNRTDPNGDMPPATPGWFVNTQLGLMLYDLEAFRTEGWTDGDLLMPWPDTSKNPADIAAENDEEAWLDANGLLLLVNRSNGALIRGE